MRNRRRAAGTRSARKVLLVAILASLVPAGLSGCSRSGATTDRGPEGTSGPVLVYVAPLMPEHPLHAEVGQLSARIAAVTEAPDLRAARTFLASPLGRSLVGPPKLEPSRLGRLARWEAEADAAAEERLREAEVLLASWPDASVARVEARLRREADDARRQLQNNAELAEMRAELAAIERYQGQIARLRHQATSEDAQEAAQVIDREVQMWREVAAEAEATRRDADARLRERRAEYETRMANTLPAVGDWAPQEQSEHLEALRSAGREMRSEQPEAVEAATAGPGTQPGTLATPAPPEMTELAALLDEIDSAQRAARDRRMVRLADARARLLRQIALGTRAAVQAVAVRNGMDVRFADEAADGMSDATEEIRPLLREYWAARPAVSSPGPTVPH